MNWVDVLKNGKVLSFKLKNFYTLPSQKSKKTTIQASTKNLVALLFTILLDFLESFLLNISS